MISLETQMVWPQMDTDYNGFLAKERTETTKVSANNVYSTNLSCKASFVESFVIVHKVNAVDLRQFCRCMPKQICKTRMDTDKHPATLRNFVGAGRSFDCAQDKFFRIDGG
jgi:hypothetical protein